MSTTTEEGKAMGSSRAVCLLRRWSPPLLGGAAGATLGALYALKVGCLTGGCPITSSPWLTGIMGALLGFTLLQDLGFKLGSSGRCAPSIPGEEPDTDSHDPHTVGAGSPLSRGTEHGAQG